MGDKRAEPGVRGKPALGERHRHARPVTVDSELAPDRRRGRLVDHMGEGIGLVAGSREEPGLDRPSFAHALDPPTALGEPHVAEPAPEEPTLVGVLRDDAERTEPTVDRHRVDTFAVVGTDDLVAPIE